MKLKSKLLAGVGALTMAGGIIGGAAPAAHAAVTHVGDCGGTVNLVKLTSNVKGQGLGDQTVPVKAAGNIAKDLVAASTTPNAGNCSGVTRPGDLHVPTANPRTTLTPKSDAVVLAGNATCASGAAATAVDATGPGNGNDQSYPLNGKITYTFTQTYTDLISAATVPFKMQVAVALKGIGNGSNGPDVVDVGGIVLTGVNAGAAATGTIWEDPVAKAPKGTPPASTSYNSGYVLDLGPAIGCADGTAGNANVLQVLSSGGGAPATSTSLLGSTGTTGLSFDFGEPTITTTTT